MRIKLPKKLKSLIALRGTEILLENRGMDYTPETPAMFRWLLTKMAYARANRYKSMMEIVVEASRIIDSMRDMPLSSDELITMSMTSYLESDIETNFEDDLLRLFKDEELGIWMLEHYTGDRIF